MILFHSLLKLIKIVFKYLDNNIDKEIVAFSNSNGGRIFLGISDDCKIKGYKLTNKLRSQIQDIAINCDPKIEVHIFEVLDSITVISVKEGDDKPYKCSSGFYIRVGANSQKLKRDDIIDLVRGEERVRFDEQVCRRFEFEKHFDKAKLKRFLKLADIETKLDSYSILKNLGVAEKQEGKIIFNNAGVLFFSKDLDFIYPHARITCALFKGKTKVEVLDKKDFNEDLVSSVDGAMIFLRQHLPIRMVMTGMPKRKDVPAIPFGALREAIINAVTHRDYFDKGCNVMVEIFDDRVEVYSWGSLPKGLTVDTFGTRSIPRNHIIADLMRRVDYIEQMGTGIEKIRTLMKDANLPDPIFKFSNFFTVIFKRNDTANDTVNDTVRFSALQNKELNFLKEIRDNSFSVQSFSEKHDMSQSTVKRVLKKLGDDGIIVFQGPSKTGRYLLTKAGEKYFLKKCQTLNTSINSNSQQGNELLILTLIQKGVFTVQEFSLSHNVSSATIKRTLKKLKESHLIVFQGPSKNGKYLLTKTGEKFLKNLKNK